MVTKIELYPLNSMQIFSDSMTLGWVFGCRYHLCMYQFLVHYYYYYYYYYYFIIAQYHFNSIHELDSLGPLVLQEKIGVRDVPVTTFSVNAFEEKWESSLPGILAHSSPFTHCGSLPVITSFHLWAQLSCGETLARREHLEERSCSTHYVSVKGRLVFSFTSPNPLARSLMASNPREVKVQPINLTWWKWVENRSLGMSQMCCGSVHLRPV